MPTPDGPQFKEIQSVRGVPVRILSDEGMASLIGKKADVHMHTPATEQLGRPIFSVLVGGRVAGHAESIAMQDAKMKVDKKELERHLGNPTGGKTRNTFVSGVISAPLTSPATNRLKIRPGSMTDAETGEDVSSGMSVVELGPKGPFYRP